MMSTREIVGTNTTSFTRTQPEKKKKLNNSKRMKKK